MQFFKSFSSFPNEIDKKEQIQKFCWLIIYNIYIYIYKYIYIYIYTYIYIYEYIYNIYLYTHTYISNIYNI